MALTPRYQPMTISHQLFFPRHHEIRSPKQRAENLKPQSARRTAAEDAKACQTSSTSAYSADVLSAVRAFFLFAVIVDHTPNPVP
jgi:hypothetical protein